MDKFSDRIVALSAIIAPVALSAIVAGVFRGQIPSVCMSQPNVSISARMYITAVMRLPHQ